MAGRKESFLLVSLSEDKAKQLAQVVTNDTCRKVLDFLADKEATESEVAHELKLPISTVHYNLQQLIKGGLVVTEDYHYSEKGKEVNHYKLANKFIIIAPKSTWGLKEKLRKILPIAAVTVIGAFGVELARRLLSGSISTMSFAAKEAGNAVMRAAPQAMDFAAEEMLMTADTAPPVADVVVRTFPIWQQAALWFLIGGFVAIITYLIVDWMSNR
ncbi:MAG: helix-turn-helix domain-containing protein [Nanoarchaeota archaeon]|nr:helix-turn-helix domain-containing protein [Nanoarchaeota archaeon]MBU1854981.1 helix-turn-helix domain-containing protein [Nanoarchaeota archaeon]